MRWKLILAVLIGSPFASAQSIRWEQIRNPHLLSGTSGARPTCTASLNGFIYVATDATSGSNTFACLAGTWVLQAGGGGGGGGISGPGSSTINFVPQWSNTLGTAIGVGLPVSSSGTPNAIVQSNSSGQLNSGFFPASIPSTAAGITGLPALGTGPRLPTISNTFAAGNCVNVQADGTLDASGAPISGLSQNCVKFNASSITPVPGKLIIWDPTTGSVGDVNNGPSVGTTPTANFVVQAGAGGTIAAGWLPATIASNTTGTAAGITGFTILGSATQLATASGTFTNGNCVATNAAHSLVDTGAPCAGGGGGGGTVTSVDINTLSGFMTFSGGPITVSGAFSPAFVTQSANLGLFGPATGASAAPAFRHSVIADMPVTHLGSLIYGGSAGAPTELLGNTSTSQQVLCQTGTGSVSAAPAWCSVSTGVTSVAPDTNVTGSIAGSVLTLGWTGSLSTARGGLGTSITSPAAGTYPKSNGSAYIASTLAAAGIGSCSSQVVTALNGDAAPTCTTVTSAFVNNSIALTGVDINTSNQVTGINGAAVPASALFLGSNSLRQLTPLTASQATAALNVATSSLQGLAPASGGGTTNFLRADLTWAIPPGGGGGGSGGGLSGWTGTPLSFVTTSTQFAPFVGGGLTSTTESVVSSAVPVAVTLSNLQVSLSSALGAAVTLTVALRDNGVDTAFICTTGSGGSTCNFSGSVNVQANHLLAWRLSPGPNTVTSGVPQITIAYAVGTSNVGVTSISTTGPISGGPISSSGTISCPTCVFASSVPSAGVGHFVGGTNAIISSTIATADIAGNAVTGAKLAQVQTYRTCSIAVGDQSSSTVLVNGQLGPQQRFCVIPAAATIQEVLVTSDAGTPSVIVDDQPPTGLPSHLLSSALATASGGAPACSNAGGTTSILGSITCSATLQNTGVSGSYISLSSGTVTGSPHYMTIHVIYTVN